MEGHREIFLCSGKGKAFTVSRPFQFNHLEDLVRLAHNHNISECHLHGPKLDSQHPQGSLQPFVTPFPGDPRPSSGYTQACIQHDKIRVSNSYFHLVSASNNARSTFFFFFLIGTGSHHTALAGLELAMQIRLDLSSKMFACLCLPSAGIKGIHLSLTPFQFFLFSSS